MDKHILAETLYDELSNVPVDDEGLLEESFLTFGAGTPASDAWYWLDDRFHSALAIMFEEKE